MKPLTIFCDTLFPPAAHATLVAGVKRHALVLAAQPTTSNLRASVPDPAMADADVVLGQPDPGALLEARHLGWVQLSSAGYGRYDTDLVRDAARTRGFALCTASQVYADPCAEHALAFMMAAARQLPECFADAQEQRWQSTHRRSGSFLLRGQRVLLLGWGAIARRLAALLAPFEVELVVYRRRATSAADGAAAAPSQRVAPQVVTTRAELDAALGEADHVVDLLPENADTVRLMDAGRFAHMKPSARFYNVGRGATVDQQALRAALERGAIAGAFLDVTTPEPLPPDDPLWHAPRCVVTPHSAGGRNTEHVAIVEHFLANLARFERGEPLADRVM